METLVAIVALCVAIRQLRLQREEIRLNSRVNALIHLAGLLRHRIDYHERIIADLKSRKGDFSGHAVRVNSELRPLLSAVHDELVGLMTLSGATVDVPGVRVALGLPVDETATAGRDG